MRLSAEKDMNHAWPKVAEPPPFPPDLVHVWRMSLLVDERGLENLLQTLSPEEKERAAAFKFETHRRHFIAARGQLRRLLGAYLQRAPESVALVPGAYGKPGLARGQGDDALRFNLSHSDEAALFAFGHGREVGVDVEKIRDGVDELAIARQVFAATDVHQLEALAGSARREAFFHAWTRLEALAKVSGQGLGFVPEDGLSFLRPAPTGIVMAGQGADAAIACRVVSLQLESGLKGAVAAEGSDWRIACLEWERS
ncbi:MAG TPA: 4'-phosphopantetheinyl transferase superfamily protein [Opitutaceae bacterium]|jgi:4'-phosphopantetheinyl transferase|nr:4'-phosphopantetheinyl transferase superfamily protein [Opitutaceae bacterium]